jgi:Uri superfamily endonuclease
MEETGRFESDRGTYILLLELGKTQKIKPGRLGQAAYEKGTYAYVGRASIGLKARIRRHIRSEKKLFWHIDYLLQKAKLKEIWIREDFFDECGTASKLRHSLPLPSFVHKGFGSSDCRCRGHLLHISYPGRGLPPILRKMKFQKVTFNGNKL